jgi:sulfite reductase (NADPH) flavoprotein alpha-component
MTQLLSSLPPDVRRLALAAIVVGLYLLLCAGIALKVALRKAKARREEAALASGAGEPVLVAFASQTGFAEELAMATAKALQAANLPVRLRELAAVEPADLSGRALFIVSTTGEGDAPDNARRFIRDVMATEPSLPGLSYAVLALGDSSYAQYCAFGRSLDAWLARNGGSRLFDTVEVDDGEAAALRHWQSQLSALTGSTDAPDWSRPAYGRWKLADRRLLNPGSAGEGAFHVRLEPPDGEAAWRAGDIVEIGPRNAPAEVAQFLSRLSLEATAPVKADEAGNLGEALSWRRLPHEDAAITALVGTSPQTLVDTLPALPHREYSIASLPADGGVELVVRLMRRADGKPGLGSGWLVEHAEVGGEIAGRVRSNRSFHAPEDDRPMILIGAGTGLAGLRSHLKARAALGRNQNWLIFGERSSAHDFFHRGEVEAWIASGVLARLDLAFSRDQAEKIYVQHRLGAAADEVRAWVANGAAIYVCGSLEGMSREVHATLAEILGGEALEDLADQGRYRRDVY